MSRSRRSESLSAVVLRRWTTPKGDIVVSLLGQRGRTKAFVHGGARGKHAAALNSFHHVDLLLAYKNGFDLPTVEQSQLVGALPKLAQPERHAYAHLLAELADLIFPENAADEQSVRIWENFTGALRGLSNHPDPEVVALVMAHRLLQLAGFAQPVAACGTCRRNVPNHTDPRGLLRCAACGRGEVIPQAEMSWLQNLQCVSVADSLAAPPEHRRVLWRSLQLWVDASVGQLNSWRLLP